MGLDVAVEFQGAVEDVFCVVGAELEECFVAGAQESEDLMLPLDAHFGGVFPLFCESVAECGVDCGSRDDNVPGIVRAGDHVRLGWGETSCCRGVDEVRQVLAIRPIDG